MTGVFRANNPYNNFLLFIYALAIKLPMFLFPPLPLRQDYDGFLYKMFLRGAETIATTFTPVYSVITFGLLFLQAVMINGFANNQRLFPRPNYLTGMAYLLITSLFLDFQRLSSPLILSTLLIWLWLKLAALQGTNSPKSSMFNMGFLLGIGTYIYYPSFIFLILVVAGVFLFRPFRLSEWIIVILGLLTPFYLLFSLLYLTDNFTGIGKINIGVSVPQISALGWRIAGVILMLLLTFSGLYFIQKNFLRQLVHARKCWVLIYWWLILALFVPFMNDESSVNNWILGAAPLAAIIGASFFYFPQKWVNLLLHWVFLAFVVLVNYRIFT